MYVYIYIYILSIHTYIHIYIYKYICIEIIYTYHHTCYFLHSIFHRSWIAQRAAGLCVLPRPLPPGRVQGDRDMGWFPVCHLAALSAKGCLVYPYEEWCKPTLHWWFGFRKHPGPIILSEGFRLRWRCSSAPCRSWSCARWCSTWSAKRWRVGQHLAFCITRSTSALRELLVS